MSETIFHLDNSGHLSEMNEETYISEDLLQQLLADYPSLISGTQINSLRPRRWLLISREFRVPALIPCTITSTVFFKGSIQHAGPAKDNSLPRS